MNFLNRLITDFILSKVSKKSQPRDPNQRYYLLMSDHAKPVDAVHNDIRSHQRRPLHDSERIYFKVYGFASNVLNGGLDGYFSNVEGEPATDNCIRELREFGRPDLAVVLADAVPYFVAYRRSEYLPEDHRVYLQAMETMTKRIYSAGFDWDIFDQLNEFLLLNYPWGRGARP